MFAKYVRIAGAVFALVIFSVFVANMTTTVGADEIVVRQSVGGELTVWVEPGFHCQCFGTLTRYKRSAQFWFSKKDNEGKALNDAIKTRFADGGHADISGSIRYDLPLDYDHMLALHRTYHSMVMIEHELVNTAVTKAVYMMGPLMTSKESYAERRPDILSIIADQVAHGVYRTAKHEVDGVDAITGEKKKIAIREIVEDPTAPGGRGREEKSALDRFAIGTSNFSINAIDYDPEVEAQIKQQQKAMMDVQTAQAESKKAEQRALTVAKEGEAEAAKSKWAQEAIKATEVTKAEQERDVAKLALETAKLAKDTTIAEGEGLAKKAELIMRSNGYMLEKIEAFKTVNHDYAAALAAHQVVPDIVMNSGGGKEGGGSSSAVDLINLLTASTAKQLHLDKDAAPPAKK